MKIKEFRGVDFINREKEIEYFINNFQNKPEKILWVYGPKSTGKTTLIEYIIENKLDKNKTIRYINFRAILIGSYKHFLDGLLEEKDEEIQTELNRTYNIFNLFKLEAKTLKKIKEDRKNLFNYLIEEFKKTKNNIFIIDEIQKLQDIYINGNRLLLNEFLNFCVRLTKETHLSHVVILTSNTIFLNNIYNNSKLKKTSKFELIDHLEYETIKEWLKTKKISQEDIELIYEYLGGCATDIKKLLEEYKYFNSIKDYLIEETQITKNEIEFSFRGLRKQDKEYLIEPFRDIIKDIVKTKYSKRATKKHDEAIEYFCDIEILFFDPIKNITTANSKIYIKAFKELLKGF